MSKINLLLVEDDPNLGLLLKEYLIAKGFDVTLKTNGEEGYDAFVKDQFQFVVLDVMMPVKDGFTLAEEIRGIDKQVPLLFLTAKSMKEDTLKGFDAGADDYMTKPFSMEELMARINAILRRSQMGEEDERTTFAIGQFEFHPLEQKLINGEESTKLTTKENELLRLLCQNKNGILERNHALKAVWGDDNYFNGRSMDVYIAKLRKYLRPDEKIEIINVHGKGFKLLVN